MRLSFNIKATRAGLTLLEVLLAVLVAFMLYQSLVWIIVKGQTEVRKRNVADHFLTIVKATEKYLQQNHSTLLAGSTPTDGPVITLADLRAAQCLPERVGDINGWNQSYLITTRLTADEGNLTAVILTTGGWGVSANDLTFANVTVPETAALARIGFIPVDPPNSLLRGPYGSWVVTLADMGLAGESGHLGLLTSLDSQDLKQDYLYRVAVPGHPELNAMQTELDMTDHAIRGVGEIQYVDHAIEEMEGVGTTTEDEGRTFLDAERGLYLCREGHARVISDTGNSLPMQDATLATDSQIIDKPVCPAGSATHPEIFVMPSIAAAAATVADATAVKPMHSYQVWATNYPATNPNATQWQVRMRILTSDNTWIYPTANYGRMVVFTSCVRD
jgi:hypothetical protein